MRQDVPPTTRPPGGRAPPPPRRRGPARRTAPHHAPPPPPPPPGGQKAADLYTEAVALIRKGKHREAAEKLSRALERGATEPNEMQGTETRFLAKRYDPYYWLGVAQMEMGLTEQALANLEKSETYGLVKKWPEEWADLSRRKELLLARLEPAAAPRPTALLASAPPAVRPAPTPVAPVAVVAAVPAATPIALKLPTPPPDRVAALPAARPSPAPSVASPAALLAAALDDLGAGRLVEAEARVLAASRADPRSPRPDVLRAFVLATRFVLEGETDDALLQRAREALVEWRRKAGPLRPLPPLLSPALRKLLAGSGRSP